MMPGLETPRLGVSTVFLPGLRGFVFPIRLAAHTCPVSGFWRQKHSVFHCRKPVFRLQGGWLAYSGLIAPAYRNDADLRENCLGSGWGKLLKAARWFPLSGPLYLLSGCYRDEMRKRSGRLRCRP